MVKCCCQLQVWAFIPPTPNIDNDGGRFGVSRAGEIPAPNRSPVRALPGEFHIESRPLIALDRVNAGAVSEQPKASGIFRLGV
jgi:hypothetical protein